MWNNGLTENFNFVINLKIFPYLNFIEDRTLLYIIYTHILLYYSTEYTNIKCNLSVQLI